MAVMAFSANLCPSLLFFVWIRGGSQQQKWGPKRSLDQKAIQKDDGSPVVIDLNIKNTQLKQHVSKLSSCPICVPYFEFVSYYLQGKLNMSDFLVICYLWRSCRRSSSLVMTNYLPTTKSKGAQRSRLKVKFYICISFVAFLTMQDSYTNPSKSNLFDFF